MGLRGREAELERIRVLLRSAASGEGGALLVRGEAGVGKSALLEHVRADAGESGYTVLSATGLEAEAELPFFGLSDLLRPLSAVIDRLPAAQAAALRGALALGEPTGADRFRIYLAALGLLTAAAEDAPLLLCVDDVQWLDLPTTESLAFVGRRLAHEPVFLLMAWREGTPTLVADAGFEELRLEGLDPRTAGALLESSAGRPVAPTVAERLVAGTGGNPLALIELGGLLSDAQLAGRVPLDEPLQVGSAVERSFLRQLDALPERTRHALLVAAADDSVPLTAVARALEALDLNTDDLAPAENAHLISIDGGHVRFRHPIARSAVYQSAAPDRRREAHATLASACSADGLLLRAGWHRASSAVVPDEEIARELELVADESMRRGGPVPAARAYRRAAELSTDTEAGAQRLFRAAEALWLGSYPELALAGAEEALALTREPARRADIVSLRGQAEMWLGDARRAFATLLNEAERIERHDTERATELRGRAVTACFAAGTIADALPVAEAAYAAASAAGGVALVGAQAALAITCGFGAMGERARSLGEPVVALAEGLADVPDTGDLVQSAALIATLIERYDRARPLLEKLLGSAESSERWGLVPFSLALLAELDFRQGRWLDCYRRTVTCEEQCRQYGHAWSEMFAALVTARLQAAWGMSEEARTRCEAALAFGERYDLETFRLLARSAQGWLELTRGDHERAAELLNEADRVAERTSATDPATARTAPELIECLVRLEREDEAAAVLDRFERHARSSMLNSAAAAVLRCRGMLAQRTEYDTHFAQALTLHDAHPEPFEQARTRLLFGERLRRDRRRADAREQLRAALEVFQRLRAEPWAARAGAELEATGLTARSRSAPDVSALTPQELQIALLVARGATNREVASELFLSTKTIEKHLGSTYRKLGIRSRAELARHVALEGLNEESS